MVFSNTKVKSDNVELKMEEETISEVSKTKFLGVIIDNKLNWQRHLNYISCKVAKGMYLYEAYTMPLSTLIWCIATMYGEMLVQYILTNRLYYKRK